MFSMELFCLSEKKSSGIKDSIVEDSQAMTRRDQQLLAHQKEMIDECKKTHKL